MREKRAYAHKTAYRMAALLLILVVLVPACALAAESEYSDFSDLNGKTVGMLDGAPFEELVREKIPEVKGFRYLVSVPDIVMELKNEKIDALLINNAVGEVTVKGDDQIAIFPKTLGDTKFGFAFKKDDPEREKWQAALDSISDETKNDMWKKWTGDDDSLKTVPEQDWEGSNGTVQVSVCDTMEPMSYRGEGGELVGFDVEMILTMARELDVRVKFNGMDFKSAMPSVETGKATIAAGGIEVTEGRRESVDFVEYYPGSFVLVVRSAAEKTEKTGFWSRIAGSFYRTFIQDGRYKMVLSGLGITVLITVTSGLLGLLIGFAAVFLRQKDRPFTNRLTSGYESLIIGIPEVVILMVLYYIVFGLIGMPAIIVAIIGFALIFGAQAYGVIWSAVGSVDPGQREAALALGYSELSAFREVILPQAQRVYLPILQSQILTLVKQTSIAGYITVFELTRAGDLIRNSTMEAFFPLIAIAVIYFVMTRLLQKLIAVIEGRLNREWESRKIRGVDK